MGTFNITVLPISGNFFVPNRRHPTSIACQIRKSYSGTTFLRKLGLLNNHMGISDLSSSAQRNSHICQAVCQSLTTNMQRFSLASYPSLKPIVFTVTTTGNNTAFANATHLHVGRDSHSTTVTTRLTGFNVNIAIRSGQIIVRSNALRAPARPLQNRGSRHVIVTLTLLYAVANNTVASTRTITGDCPSFFRILGSLRVKLALRSS